MQSPVWGNKSFDVTQAYGVNEPGVPDSWYAYVAEWGLPYGTHGALDIGMPNGTKLYSPVAGKVIFAGENLDVFRPGYVEIEYKLGENTERFILGHMNKVEVSGGFVKAGQYVGLSGEQTKKGTRIPDGSGPHLHAERRDITRQKLLDPTPILTGSSAKPFGVSTSSNWPSAEKIDAWSAKAGNGNSPVKGMGSDFVAFGEKYGINPGIVVAIMQRESQMGADGSKLPTLNNFAGITTTASDSNGFYFIDRYWKVYGSPKAGLEGVFKLLDSDIYRSTGGRLEDVMAKYAPPFENEWGPMFNTFSVVGDNLGITITKDTNIYGNDSTVSGGGGFASVDGLLSFVGESGPRVGAGVLGVLVLGIGLVLVFGGATPVGRVAKIVKGVANAKS